MKNLINFGRTAIISLLLGNGFLLAGQNAGAGIRFDLNSSTGGNQNITQIPCPGANTNVRIDIYVIDASNLDTYEFNLIFDPNNFEFLGGSEDNPSTWEKNFLKKNEGSTTGFTCTASDGVVNCANTLVGDQGEDTPDGEGLLASIGFKCLVDCPGNLSFGAVYWYDNAGIKDECTDKGIATLPVQMTNIMATSNQESGITLTWQTENEIGIAGYHVWRSDNDKKDFSKITNSLIPASPDNLSSNEYSYSDKNISHGVTYWYKIESISVDGSSEFFGPVSTIAVLPIPEKFGLSQNYPNPFNPKTTINYQLPEDSKVSIRIYNLLGKEIKELVNDFKQAGYHDVIWDGKDFQENNVSSGIYIIQIRADNYREVRKATILR